MPKYKQITIALICLATFYSCNAQTREEMMSGLDKLILGIDRTEVYLPLIYTKRTAIVANQTSMSGKTHLVDLLISKNVNVVKVFAPEHGFRGEAGPGDHIDSGKDKKTGLSLVSLYGSHRKPSPADLEGVECILFDIQDVGARFYTYISTLYYLMEACAENKIQLLVLDRPNPNGFYIDGPVLDTAYLSFVGIAPIPVVHGLTVGEFAKMANGEGWLKNNMKCELTVIEMENYNHSMLYPLPVRPSPNLPNMDAIYLYPSLCFFEGAAVSIGRGTDFPFQLIGYPGYSKGNFEFTPVEIAGVIQDPPFEDKQCKGKKLNNEQKLIFEKKQLNLEWLVDTYNAYPDKTKFFNNFFDKLAGTDLLRKQMLAGNSVEEIRKSWQPGLEQYRKIRSQYLLYPDK